MIQISLLRHKCIGCNACVEAAPERWIMAKSDGKCYLRKSTKRGNYYIAEVTDFELEENEEAAKNCPVKIIKIKKLKGRGRS